MKLKTVLALALSSVIGFGAMNVTAMAYQQNKPKKPAQKPAPKKPEAPSKELIEAGKKVYSDNGCNTCHVIGTEGGKTGPDLSKTGKSKKPETLTKFIRDPKSVVKGATMPAYDDERISDKDLKALVAYLMSLK